MSVNYNPIPNTNGMVLHLDAGNTKSYPGSGTTWYDLSGNSNDLTINASAFNSSGPKYMDFNGSYGIAKRSPDTTYYNCDMTVITWSRILNSSANWRTLLRGLSAGGDHQVIVQQSSFTLGMYDNNNFSSFNSCGYDVRNLPGYATQWNMLVWRFNNTTSPTNTSVASGPTARTLPRSGPSELCRTIPPLVILSAAIRSINTLLCNGRIMTS